MISLIRLDERLIHGQIAIKWSKHAGVDRILVVNDEAAENEVIQKSLMMAAPANCKTAIKSVKDSIAILNDARMANVKVLVIVSNPKDLLTIIHEVRGITQINIGNYGRVAERREGIQRKTFRSNLYAYEDEALQLKEIADTGIKCVYQTTPEDQPEDLASILK